MNKHSPLLAKKATSTKLYNENKESIDTVFGFIKQAMSEGSLLIIRLDEENEYETYVKTTKAINYFRIMGYTIKKVKSADTYAIIWNKQGEKVFDEFNRGETEYA